MLWHSADMDKGGNKWSRCAPSHPRDFIGRTSYRTSWSEQTQAFRRNINIGTVNILGIGTGWGLRRESGAEGVEARLTPVRKASPPDQQRLHVNLL